AFVPYAQDDLGGFWSADLRGHLSVNGGFFSNVGAVRKQFVGGALLGIGVYWDYDGDLNQYPTGGAPGTSQYGQFGHAYNQVGVSGEWLTDFGNLRSNGYIPVGTTAVSVTATDGAGNVSSGTFTVTVNSLPVITRQPVGATVNLGSPAVLAVEASGGSVSYQWLKNGVIISGGTAASYRIGVVKPSDSGIYSVVVRGAGGAVNSDSVSLVVNTKLAAVIAGAMNQRVMDPTDPLGYSVSNLPPGVVFNGTTGALDGTPVQAGTYAVSITGNGPGSNPLNFEVDVAALDAGFVGTFDGWVERNDALNRNLGSRVQFTITSRGAYSGKFITGVTSTALRGTLIVTRASGSSVQTAQISCVIPKTGITLDVALDSAGNVLFGNISDESQNSAVVKGWRNIWPAVAGNANAFKGLHTFYLQPSAIGDDSVPQGFGYGSLTVTAKTGAVILNAVLADGYRVLGSTVAGPGGEVLLYGSLYTNLGS
ncbi:MAG: hypothetical protein EBS01_14910, partial [Verrucomicrobia bacterium]|nr:hypothetical protein [Verrucomicrobiota bacterium]